MHGLIYWKDKMDEASVTPAVYLKFLQDRTGLANNELEAGKRENSLYMVSDHWTLG